MGLIEYLPDDDGLFAEAARLLRPGGRFAVSCRNRLYNLLSANDYTAQELGEEAPRLLEELREHLARTKPGDLRGLAESLAASSEELERAAAADRDVPPKELHDHRRAFQRGRRQHTPLELAPVAERHGFRQRSLLALHPHPLPPALEPLAPRTSTVSPTRGGAHLERSRQVSRSRPRSSPSSNEADVLTIVMYHYVRDDARVHARTIAELEAELDHVAEHYTAVRLEDVVTAGGPRTHACSRSTTGSSSTSTSLHRHSSDAA